MPLIPRKKHSRHRKPIELPDLSFEQNEEWKHKQLASYVGRQITVGVSQAAMAAAAAHIPLRPAGKDDDSASTDSADTPVLNHDDSSWPGGSHAPRRRSSASTASNSGGGMVTTQGRNPGRRLLSSPASGDLHIAAALSSSAGKSAEFPLYLRHNNNPPKSALEPPLPQHMSASSLLTGPTSSAQLARHLPAALSQDQRTLTDDDVTGRRVYLAASERLQVKPLLVVLRQLPATAMKLVEKGMDAKATTALAAALAANFCVQSVDMSRNLMGDGGLASIARALVDVRLANPSAYYRNRMKAASSMGGRGRRGSAAGSPSHGGRRGSFGGLSIFAGAPAFSVFGSIAGSVTGGQTYRSTGSGGPGKTGSVLARHLGGGAGGQSVFRSGGSTIEAAALAARPRATRTGGPLLTTYVKGGYVNLGQATGPAPPAVRPFARGGGIVAASPIHSHRRTHSSSNFGVSTASMKGTSGGGGDGRGVGWGIIQPSSAALQAVLSAELQAGVRREVALEVADGLRDGSVLRPSGPTGHGDSSILAPLRGPVSLEARMAQAEQRASEVASTATATAESVLRRQVASVDAPQAPPVESKAVEEGGFKGELGGGDTVDDVLSISTRRSISVSSFGPARGGSSPSSVHSARRDSAASQEEENEHVVPTCAKLVLRACGVGGSSQSLAGGVPRSTALVPVNHSRARQLSPRFVHPGSASADGLHSMAASQVSTRGGRLAPRGWDPYAGGGSLGLKLPGVLSPPTLLQGERALLELVALASQITELDLGGNSFNHDVLFSMAYLFGLPLSPVMLSAVEVVNTAPAELSVLAAEQWALVEAKRIRQEMIDAGLIKPGRDFAPPNPAARSSGGSSSGKKEDEPGVHAPSRGGYFKPPPAKGDKSARKKSNEKAATSFRDATGGSAADAPLSPPSSPRARRASIALEDIAETPTTTQKRRSSVGSVASRRRDSTASAALAPPPSPRAEGGGIKRTGSARSSSMKSDEGRKHPPDPTKGPVKAPPQPILPSNLLKLLPLVLSVQSLHATLKRAYQVKATVETAEVNARKARSKGGAGGAPNIIDSIRAAESEHRRARTQAQLETTQRVIVPQGHVFSLSKLNLSKNALAGRDGSLALACLLSAPRTPLTHLDVSWCDLGPSGEAVLLAVAGERLPPAYGAAASGVMKRPRVLTAEEQRKANQQASMGQSNKAPPPRPTAESTMGGRMAAAGLAQRIGFDGSARGTLPTPLPLILDTAASTCPSRITHLDMSFCGLVDSNSAEPLKHLLSKCSKLSYLNLGHNRLGPRSASAIADGLPAAITLSELDIGFNPLGTAGTADIIVALVRTAVDVLHIENSTGDGNAADAQVQFVWELGQLVCEQRLLADSGLQPEDTQIIVEWPEHRTRRVTRRRVVAAWEDTRGMWGELTEAFLAAGGGEGASVWSLERSVFQARKGVADSADLYDTAYQLAKAFEADWAAAKMPRVLPAPRAQLDAKALLRSAYPLLRMGWVHATTIGGQQGSPFEMSFQGFTDFRRACGVDDPSRHAHLDNCFAAAAFTDKEQRVRHVTNNALTRAQWMEALVRLALVQYPSVNANEAGGSIGTLLKLHVVPYFKRVLGVAKSVVNASKGVEGGLERAMPAVTSIGSSTGGDAQVEVTPTPPTPRGWFFDTGAGGLGSTAAPFSFDPPQAPSPMGMGGASMSSLRGAGVSLGGSVTPDGMGESMANAFRRSRLYTQAMDVAIRRCNSMLRAIFDRYSRAFRSIADTKGGKMSVDEWLGLLGNAQVARDESAVPTVKWGVSPPPGVLSARQALWLFVSSKSVVNDELFRTFKDHTRSHTVMLSFPEFIEAVARAADTEQAAAAVPWFLWLLPAEGFGGRRTGQEGRLDMVVGERGVLAANPFAAAPPGDGGLGGPAARVLAAAATPVKQESKPDGGRPRDRVIAGRSGDSDDSTDEGTVGPVFDPRLGMLTLLAGTRVRRVVTALATGVDDESALHMAANGSSASPQQPGGAVHFHTPAPPSHPSGIEGGSSPLGLWQHLPLSRRFQALVAYLYDSMTEGCHKVAHLRFVPAFASGGSCAAGSADKARGVKGGFKTPQSSLKSAASSVRLNASMGAASEGGNMQGVALTTCFHKSHESYASAGRVEQHPPYTPLQVQQPDTEGQAQLQGPITPRMKKRLSLAGTLPRDLALSTSSSGGGGGAQSGGFHGAPASPAAATYKPSLRVAIDSRQHTPAPPQSKSPHQMPPPSREAETPMANSPATRKSFEASVSSLQGQNEPLSPISTAQAGDKGVKGGNTRSPHTVPAAPLAAMATTPQAIEASTKAGVSAGGVSQEQAVRTPSAPPSESSRRGGRKHPRPTDIKPGTLGPESKTAGVVVADALPQHDGDAVAPQTSTSTTGSTKSGRRRPKAVASSSKSKRAGRAGQSNTQAKKPQLGDSTPPVSGRRKITPKAPLSPMVRATPPPGASRQPPVMAGSTSRRIAPAGSAVHTPVRSTSPTFDPGLDSNPTIKAAPSSASTDAPPPAGTRANPKLRKKTPAPPPGSRPIGHPSSVYAPSASMPASRNAPQSPAPGAVRSGALLANFGQASGQHASALAVGAPVMYGGHRETSTAAHDRAAAAAGVAAAKWRATAANSLGGKVPSHGRDLSIGSAASARKGARHKDADGEYTSIRPRAAQPMSASIIV